MKAVGVIVEYNPFHNGHKFHLEQTRLQSNADCLIAVMSGPFLQRGEPALVSKWSRTKMALEAGVDIVLELPYVFATQKAETFANGAISILTAMQCSEFCFGSEHGTITDFENTVAFMTDNKEEYDAYIKNVIKEGISYPKATSLAYHSLNHSNSFLDLSKPNNILGFHYVKALSHQDSPLKPLTIQRTQADYHDENFTSEHIASATSIRKALLKEKSIKQIENFVPPYTYQQLHTYIEQFGKFHHWEEYFDLLKYRILTQTASELKLIYEVEEGLEFRILKYIKQAQSFTEFMHLLKTKRYTWTRLQRVCLHILTNTKKEQMNNENKASYIRLLGMTQTGQQYLKRIKKELELPLVSTLSSFSDEIMELDIKATSTYAMCFPEPIRSNFIKAEFSTPPIQY